MSWVGIKKKKVFCSNYIINKLHKRNLYVNYKNHPNKISIYFLNYKYHVIININKEKIFLTHFQLNSGLYIKIIKKFFSCLEKISFTWVHFLFYFLLVIFISF